MLLSAQFLIPLPSFCAILSVVKGITANDALSFSTRRMYSPLEAFRQETRSAGWESALPMFWPQAPGSQCIG
jgi:hypothetical protein